MELIYKELGKNEPIVGDIHLTAPELQEIVDILKKIEPHVVVNVPSSEVKFEPVIHVPPQEVQVFNTLHFPHEEFRETNSFLKMIAKEAIEMRSDLNHRWDFIRNFLIHWPFQILAQFLMQRFYQR